MTQVTQSRSGETGHHPFRCGRLYVSNSAWYFLTRGGSSRGPFVSAQKAEHALKHHLQQMKNLKETFPKPS